MEWRGVWRFIAVYSRLQYGSSLAISTILMAAPFEDLVRRIEQGVGRPVVKEP